MLVPPEEEMIRVNVKPTSDLPYPARASGDIASEDNPERESLFDFTFPANNLSESWREILAESFMGISPACTPGKTFYPAVLTFYLNEYLLVRFRVFYRQVRLKAVPVRYAGVVNLFLFFFGKRPILINPGKLFRLIGYPVTGISKQILKNAVNARFNFTGQCAGNSLPICAQT